MKKRILMGICVIIMAVGIMLYIDISSGGETMPSDIFHTSADSDGGEDVSCYTAAADTQDLLMTETETESGGENDASLSYKDAEILKLVKLTTPAKGGEMVTLSISGMPLTKYEVYVYYSQKPSDDESLSPKYSDGEGNATWNFTVPSGISEGRRKIAIVGGGEILYVYIDIA